MTTFDTVRYETRDGVATIAMARPDKRNAINLAMFLELAEATELAAEDDAVRVVALRGAGPSFCAGIDVSELAWLASATADDVRALATKAQRPFLALATLEKPSVAVVHGHALGAGLQLALACDLRIAAVSASFRVLEVRFGLIPDLGGPHRLVSLVGPAMAKELVWTGRPIDGTEAARIGLVNRAVSTEGLASEADQLIATLTAGPPTTLRLGKRLVESAHGRALEDHLADAREAQVSCVSTEDHREAVAAYLEKRQPNFAGR